MIHIVYAYNHPRGRKIHYFSGIFAKLEDAESYLTGLAPEFKEQSRIQSFPEFSYPLYLIEKDFYAGPAVPITREKLAYEMAVVPKIGRAYDHEHFNYYLFLEDYRGVRPGEDYMGLTDHHHIDTEQIMWMLDGALERRELRAIEARNDK